jgi:hypothetical protein
MNGPMMGTMGSLQDAMLQMMQGGGAPQQMQPPQPQRFGNALGGKVGIRDILGTLGDTLLVGSGMQPMYAPLRQKRRVNEAFQGWAANPDDPAAFQNFLGVDPASAWAAMRQREDDAREGAQIANQRRKIELDAEQGQLTPFQRDAMAAGAPPGSPQYQRLLEARYNQMKLYGSPEGGYSPDPNWRPIFEDAVEGAEGAEAEPPEQPAVPGKSNPVRVQTPDQARQLAPGTLFMTPDGRVKRVPGGAPQAGAPTFP